MRWQLTRRAPGGNAHGLYDMDDAKKLDDAALEDVLREIEALGEITDASQGRHMSSSRPSGRKSAI